MCEKMCDISHGLLFSWELEIAEFLDVEVLQGIIRKIRNA